MKLPSIETPNSQLFMCLLYFDRNIGIASCSMAARIGGVLAPQFVRLVCTFIYEFDILKLSFTCNLCLIYIKGTTSAPCIVE